MYSLASTSLFFAVANVVSASSSSVSSIKNIFTFGDSWSAAPSAVQGLPNASTIAPLPSSGGGMWPNILGASLSAASYNFADSGATISNNIVYDFGATDFVAQVANFRGNFTNSNISQPTASNIAWTGDDSLFTLWFGVEDLGYTYAAQKDWVGTQPYMITQFDQLVSTLYHAGARKFLILSIPPVNLSPLARNMGSATELTLKTNLDYYNGRLIVYADLLGQIYPNASATYFDTVPMLNTIEANPTQYGFENSVASCADYIPASNDTALNVPICKAPLANYLWKDLYHPSFSFHKLLASEVLSLLTNNRTSIPPTQNGTPMVVLPSNTGSSAANAASNTLTPANPTGTGTGNTSSLATSSATTSATFTISFMSFVLALTLLVC